MTLFVGQKYTCLTEQEVGPRRPPVGNLLSSFCRPRLWHLSQQTYSRRTPPHYWKIWSSNISHPYSSIVWNKQRSGSKQAQTNSTLVPRTTKYRRAKISGSSWVTSHFPANSEWALSHRTGATATQQSFGVLDPVTGDTLSRSWTQEFGF